MTEEAQVLGNIVINSNLKCWCGKGKINIVIDKKGNVITVFCDNDETCTFQTHCNYMKCGFTNHEIYCGWSGEYQSLKECLNCDL